MISLRYEDLPGAVGRDLGLSDWFEIGQDRIDAFAEITGDRQWIHVDVERAQREIGGTIAHGFLTLSLLTAMSSPAFQVEGIRRAVNYGFNKVRFTDVVPAGSRVRLRQRILAVEEKGGGCVITRECIVEVEGRERPALIAEWIGVVYP